MSYHYLCTSKNGDMEFETMLEAKTYQNAFGGIIYIVMGQDRARL